MQKNNFITWCKVHKWHFYDHWYVLVARYDKKSPLAPHFGEAGHSALTLWFCVIQISCSCKLSKISYKQKVNRCLFVNYKNNRQSTLFVHFAPDERAPPPFCLYHSVSAVLQNMQKH